MSNGKFKKNLIPAVTFGSETGQDGKPLIPAVTFFPGPSQTMKVLIPAVTFGPEEEFESESGEDRTEVKALNIMYQRDDQLSLPPVPSSRPHLAPPPSDVVTDVVTQVTQAEDTIHSDQTGRLGTCVYSDLELAQLFMYRVCIRRRGQQLYVFNGKYYQALTENELYTMILQYLRQEINTAGRASTIRSVAKAIHAEPDIIVKESEVDTSKICLLDGILDTKTLQLEPHTSRYFIDWQLNSSWVSNGLDSGCPFFDRYLQDVTGGDPVLLLRFWQATGYLLIGEGNIAKRVFILTGPSDAGKSVYGSLLREFHHPEQISSIDAFKLGDRFSASSLVNARLNLSMDLPHGSLPEQAVGMIKKISGSDSVTVEVKYRTPYTAKLDCKLVFATNHPIRASVADRALARRLMILPFQYSVPKSQQDRYLLNKLLEERPAILQRAVMAYYKLKANNYVFAGDDQFNNDVIMGITDDSAMTADVVEQFVNARCIKAPGQFISTEQLHEAYKAFCQRIGSSCIQDRQQFSARVHPILETKFQATRKKNRVEGIPRNGYWEVQLVPGEP